MKAANRQLRSQIDADGTLTLSLEEAQFAEPGDDEVVVRIEAAPINPSDLGLLLGPAAVDTVSAVQVNGRAGAELKIPPARLSTVQGRIGLSLKIGNEGSGTVVAAGRNATPLLGKRVAFFGGSAYADFRTIAAKQAVPLPDSVSCAQGCAMFVNPLTALGFVETARSAGHGAIVHTAAASNLGQMLVKICQSDGIPLINIVRSDEQVQLLRALGAAHVLNSGDEGFESQLRDAIRETRATLAFDAIGGGPLGGTILRAMEEVFVQDAEEYSRYGSNVFKQLYIYGSLDTSPTVLDRGAFGFRWAASGWLLTPFLASIGHARMSELMARVVSEVTTTFSSDFTRAIGLSEAVKPEIIRAYERKATGEKYLINPTLN